MKLRGISLLAIFSVALSLLSSAPAEARMTPSQDSNDSVVDAAGFIVKYKPSVAPIAPNGQPTGENFAGVDLENSLDLGGGFKSIDFATDLTPVEMQTALDRMSADPRIASVELNRRFQSASYVPKPIMGSIIPNNDPVDLSMVVRSPVATAAAPAAYASDAWTAPNLVAVTLTWKKPNTKISGKLAGYKIQQKVGSVWKNIQTRTASNLRSYTVTNSDLRAGVSATFRIAAVSLYKGTYYTGTYRSITVTPTGLARANVSLRAQNTANGLVFSWNSLSLADSGGLQVSYQPTVLRDGSVSETCDPATSTSTKCVITPVVAGSTYRAQLRITNDHGTVNATPVTGMVTALPVNTNDPDFASKQWYLKADSANPYGNKAATAWLADSGTPTVYVAVLDTGITSHPDLNANVVAGYDMVSDVSAAHDFDGRDADPSDPGDWEVTANSSSNSSWHGTHVAGIIAAADNNVGVIGIAPNSKIIPVRVLAAGGGTEGDIVAGLNWAAGIPIRDIPDNPHPANVINMSIGGQGSCDTGSDTQVTLAAIKNLGITVVTASGNDGDLAANSYPGNCYPTINVAATGITGKPTFYSNYGSAVDIGAPGGDYCYRIGNTKDASGQIWSTLNSGTTLPGSPIYAYELGTSMASPDVAGVVALMYSALLRKTPNIAKNADLVNKIWLALSGSVTRYGSHTPPAEPQKDASGCDPYTAGSHAYGAGIVNAEGAVAAIIQ